MNLATLKHHAWYVTQALGAWSAWFFGLNWGGAGQFMGFVVSVLVAMNMLGILNPMKAKAAAIWAARRPAPVPAVRSPQDE